MTSIRKMECSDFLCAKVISVIEENWQQRHQHLPIQIQQDNPTAHIDANIPVVLKQDGTLR